METIVSLVYKQVAEDNKPFNYLKYFNILQYYNNCIQYPIRTHCFAYLVKTNTVSYFYNTNIVRLAMYYDFVYVFPNSHYEFEMMKIAKIKDSGVVNEYKLRGHFDKLFGCFYDKLFSIKHFASYASRYSGIDKEIIELGVSLVNNIEYEDLFDNTNFYLVIKTICSLYLESLVSDCIVIKDSKFEYFEQYNIKLLSKKHGTVYYKDNILLFNTLTKTDLNLYDGILAEYEEYGYIEKEVFIDYLRRNNNITFKQKLLTFRLFNKHKPIYYFDIDTLKKLKSSGEIITLAQIVLASKSFYDVECFEYGNNIKDDIVAILTNTHATVKYLCLMEKSYKKEQLKNFLDIKLVCLLFQHYVNYEYTEDLESLYMKTLKLLNNTVGIKLNDINYAKKFLSKYGDGDMRRSMVKALNKFV